MWFVFALLSAIFATLTSILAKVVPIDKLSVVFTLVLAFVFLHEEFTTKSSIGCILIVQEIGEDKFNNGYILDIRWKKDVHFILCINRWSGKCLYYVLRNGEQISNCYFGKKNEEKFLDSIQHLVNEINNGDFDYKKTESEKIAEIIIINIVEIY